MDPHWFQADPDPDHLMTKNCKIGQLTKFFLKKKLQNRYLFLGLHEDFQAKKKTSSTSKNMEFRHFCSFLWVLFAFPGSESSRPKSLRIHADLDPQHWIFQQCLREK